MGVQELSVEALGRLEPLLDVVVPLLVALEPEGFYTDPTTKDLREAARRGLTGVLTVLTGIPSAEDPLEAPRSAGRRQVQQNLPLEGVLRAYRVAGKALWDDLVAVARRRGDQATEDLLDGASELWQVVDLFSDTASAAYRKEEAALRTRDDRVRGSVLAALLDGRGSHPEFVRDATRALGVAAGTPVVCVVGLAPEPHAVAIDAPRVRLQAKEIESVWISTGEGEVGMIELAGTTPSKLRALLAPGVRGRAGMSPVLTTLDALPRARRMADLAARSNGRKHEVAQLDEDLVAALTVDSPLVADLVVERTVGRLLAEPGGDGQLLLDTVRAFLRADGALNTAAATSFVHRNTMLYRLNKIDKITDTKVRSLSDQVLWVLALKSLDARQA